MFRICKTLEIESGHMLSRHPEKCRFPHGHSRRVEIVLEAPDLDANGMVCDFKAVKDAVGEYLDTFDHALCVNTQDPMYHQLKEAYGAMVIGFEDTEPTTEILARTFFESFGRLLSEYARRPDTPYHLRTEVRVARVRVWETASSWAEFGE